MTQCAYIPRSLVWFVSKYWLEFYGNMEGCKNVFKLKIVSRMTDGCVDQKDVSLCFFFFFQITSVRLWESCWSPKTRADHLCQLPVQPLAVSSGTELFGDGLVCGTLCDKVTATWQDRTVITALLRRHCRKSLAWWLSLCLHVCLSDHTVCTHKSKRTKWYIHQCLMGFCF